MAARALLLRPLESACAGGATALIASSLPVIGPWAGFKFVLTILWACVIMLAVAMVVNNISHRRRYPTYWMGS